MRTFILFCVLFPRFAFALGCPTGPRETKLTLSRVMRNFGSFTLSADSVADGGLSDPSSIHDAELNIAVSKLQLAEACALAVVNDPDDSLLPAKAEDLQGAARAAYVKLFRDTMRNFYDGLAAYEGEFRVLLATPPAQREYTKVEAWKVEIDARATHAHEILSK